MTLLRNFIALVILAFLSASGVIAQSIIDTNRGDPAVDRAMRAAGNTLAQFDRAYREQSGEGFQVRIVFTHPGGREHIWMTVSSVTASGYAGTIVNTPRHLGNIRQGQDYAATRDRITDWTFLRAGLAHGHHVWRVLASRMSPQEAASYGVRLSPKP